MAKTLVRPKDVPDGPFRLTRRDHIAAVLIGLVGGFIVGLTSVGTGVFFGLTLLVVFPLKAHKVVGTDIFRFSSARSPACWSGASSRSRSPSGCFDPSSRPCSDWPAFAC
jgi:uncharacterized membrane protein YfcA